MQEMFQLPTLGLIRLRKKVEEKFVLPAALWSVSSAAEVVAFVKTNFCPESSITIPAALLNHQQGKQQLICILLWLQKNSYLDYMVAILTLIVIPEYKHSGGGGENWKAAVESYFDVYSEDGCNNMTHSPKKLPSWHRLRFDLFVLLYCLSAWNRKHLLGPKLVEFYQRKIGVRTCFFEKINEDSLKSSTIQLLLDSMDTPNVEWSIKGFSDFFRAIVVKQELSVLLSRRRNNMMATKSCASPMLLIGVNL